ncbi:MAG: hypothetical protein HY898_21290 [Deltaproteobacteria bacterium]|nr:hypothetical protein [Deltaproteobacteria bacterium]
MHERVPIAMKRVWGASTITVTIMATSGLGCMPLYVEPPPTAPHALVKIRIANHDAPGPSLEESLVLNKHRVKVPKTEGDFLVARASALRVRLEPAYWSMQTTFYHTYTTTSTQSYSYGCGKSTCTGTRTVTQTHRAIDGACKATVAFSPEVNQMYLLQYDFFANDQCRLQCMMQLPNAEGSFELTPCAAVESTSAQK